MSQGRSCKLKSKETSDSPLTWTPGPYARRLEAGEDVHLHFQSQNKEEQNGAVLMTFQSSVPSFKGDGLSHPQSLLQTAAIRTICHMLREPLFNQLRTQEQLGYIVSSYYDTGFSAHNVQSDLETSEQTVTVGTTPIDSVVVNVLSKKVPPPVLTRRIDEFLGTFRETLSAMPDEEIRSHTDALSRKLLKPKQKLDDEAGLHFGKISKYAPEVLEKALGPSQLPWNSAEHLASSIKGLNRGDLLQAWDNVVAGKKRARIVSHVYGSTFPLSSDGKEGDFASRHIARSRITCLKSMEDIKVKRQELVQYSDKIVEKQRLFGMKKVGLAAVGVIGTSLLLCAINSYGRKNGSTTRATASSNTND
eukprot:CAMPEP_0197245224 /NCGR_PEP_ID=MMETSP1429-20130617/10072_1 /TAXON_ID=49237 /ORGANISM="Chaetoceros  sp., Strain UNC1202" /LENGTH=361 /DNA_ID=CAMNT_0042705679 /DNA_START=69 /DNA_END=1154 /DNA_ORIENTATION=-